MESRFSHRDGESGLSRQRGVNGTFTKPFRPSKPRYRESRAVLMAFHPEVNADELTQAAMAVEASE